MTSCHFWFFNLKFLNLKNFKNPKMFQIIKLFLWNQCESVLHFKTRAKKIWRPPAEMCALLMCRSALFLPQISFTPPTSWCSLWASGFGWGLHAPSCGLFQKQSTLTPLNVSPQSGQFFFLAKFGLRPSNGLFSGAAGQNLTPPPKVSAVVVLGWRLATLRGGTCGWCGGSKILFLLGEIFEKSTQFFGVPEG